MDREKLGLTAHAIDAIRDGQYTLLMGAGGSFDAKSRDGRPLPSGATFAEEISKGLSLNISPNTPLSYVWDAAIQKCGSEQELRRRFCSPRFLHCRPAAYHYKIPTFAWRRIYTFNVDDVLPESYKSGAGALQHPVAVHFDDDYKEADPVTDECQIVYLHGSELFPDQPLVFGPPAYAAAVTRQHTWWHVFASGFLCEPCIVIGASLREPDFETYLAWKRRPVLPMMAPSLFVSPQIDDAARAICSRLGLTPIEMSGEDFITQLDLVVDERAKISVRRAQSLNSLSLLSSIKLTPALATLARQFVIVNDKSSWPLLDRAPERFLEGYSPSWEDIGASRDVHLGISATIVEYVRALFSGPASSRPINLICVEGTAGSGKTTVLMRTAIGTSEMGVDTLYFLGHNRLPVGVIVDVAKGLPSDAGFVLVIDDAEAHVAQVRRLIESYPAKAGRCVVICAVRSGKRRVFEQSLFDLLDPRFERISSLTRTEAADLIDKLRAAAKLGRFAGWTESQLVEQFASTKPGGWFGQILAILLQVVPGTILDQRLDSEWASLKTDDLKTFYGAICLAAACGIPVRLPVAFRSVFQMADAKSLFEELTTGSMRGLVEWFNQEFARPRHRVVGEETVRHCMNSDELFHISRRLTLALAPYVSRQTIIRHTPEARLARELMDTDGLVVPALKDRAEEWFATLENDWGWNSRYWEQRALAAIKARHFRRARDFAEQAVGIEHHPLPMTTFAVVKLASIEHDEELDRIASEELFAQAIDLLDSAIRFSQQKYFISFHSYHVLFLQAVRVARKLRGSIPDVLREMIEYHGGEAERLFPHDPEMIKSLERLKVEDGLRWDVQA